MRLFHGTHPAHRDAITAHGLTPGAGLSDEGMLGEGITAAVFLTPDPEEAATYGTDVWAVDATGLNLISIDGPDGAHYAATATIPADTLALAAHATAEGTNPGECLACGGYDDDRSPAGLGSCCTDPEEAR